MPIVLLEVGAMELQVVTTDVGESAALVRPLVSGIVVPPKSNAELANAMLRVMDVSPAERASMGRDGREHVRMYFDIETVAAEWASFRKALFSNGISPRGCSRERVPETLLSSPGTSGEAEGLPAHHRLKAVGSLARLKAPEARHERLIPSP
jgi:hypothetical protein